MYAHIESNVGGWWAGVLHPMEVAHHLVTMLLVGLLGGLAVRAGRSSWTLPATFVVAVSGFALIAGAFGRRPFDVDAVLIVMAVVLAVLVFVHPRRTGAGGLVAVSVSGALLGMAHGTDGSGSSRPVAYAAGFTFTGGLLLAVGAIVGATIGRALRGRRSALDDIGSADREDRALV